MGSHYIPVGKIKIDKDILDIVCPAAGYDETPPPPEIYCPANGYYAGEIFVIDPEYPEIPTPLDSEIWLIVSRLSGDELRFATARTNNSPWKAELMDGNYTVLETLTGTSTIIIQIPKTGGKPSSYGYNTFLVKISVENKTDVFTSCYVYSTNQASIHGARFRLPDVISMNNLFRYGKDLEFVIFDGSYDNLTRLDYAFYQQKKLVSVVMPSALPELTRMDYTFYQTDKLQTVQLPSSLPKLTNVYRMFYQSKGLKTFTMPDTPLLTDMRDAWNANIALTTLTFAGEEFTVLNKLTNCVTGCHALRKLKLPNLPSVTSLSNLCYLLESLEELIFPDALPLCTELANAARAPNLKKIVIPLSLPVIETMQSFSYGVSCVNWRECTFGTNIVNCSGIVENNRVMTEFYQPTLRTSSFSFGSGGGNVETVEIHWPSVTDSFQMWYHKLSTAEINRIMTELPTASNPGVSYIDFRGNPGTEFADWSIAEAKGWVVNGKTIYG